MKQVFPNIRPRRLGTRGNSRYCYAALRKTTSLAVPSLSLTGSKAQFDETKAADNLDQSPNLNASDEDLRIVRLWASKVLHAEFSSTKELAEYITTNQLIDNPNRQSRLRPTPKSRACSKEKHIADNSAMVRGFTK